MKGMHCCFTIHKVGGEGDFILKVPKCEERFEQKVLAMVHGVSE